VLKTTIQTAVELVYPPRCVGCGVLVNSDHGLCGSCWGETPFIGGTACDKCGIPLAGESDTEVHCDDCMTIARPWDQGRAALVYKDNGRKLVLGLKHGDRQEIAPLAGKWLAQSVRDVLQPNMLIAPVPLHWMRFLKRRYNQSALIAQALGRETGLMVCPDLFERPIKTPSLDGLTRDERFAQLQDSIRLSKKRRHLIAAGRPLLIVDDVMTSGATLAACAEAARASQAGDICIAVLARVAKDA